MTKIIRRISAFFISLSFMCTIAPFVFADSSGTNYWVHIKESGTWINDLIRNAAWGILKAMSELINYIQQAIIEVLHWNLYDKLKKLDPSFDITTGSVKAVALAILVIAAMFAGILIIVNGDKMHIKDSVKNILVAICLIGALPALMQGLDDFMFGSNGGVGYASSYSISDKVTKQGTVKLLGDEVLAQQLYDNVATVSNNHKASTGKQYTLYDSDTYDNGTMPRDININKLATQNEIDVKYAGSTTSKRQRKFSELTMNNCVSLLGFSKEYAVLQHLKDAGYKPSEKIDVGLVRYGRNSTYTIGELEKKMIDSLLKSSYNIDGGTLKVSDSKNYDIAKNAETFEECVDDIKDDIVWQLNYIENRNNALGNNTDVSLKSLRTQKEYDKMSWIEQAVTVDIWEPNEDERVYAYDFDFFPTFVDMCIIIVCLVFALLKLCRMLWEIAFMHIFVPLVVATDAHGSGRAKRAIQHLLSTFAILIVILITLKLYISLIGEMHSIKNLIARWGLILAGAHFVIDGSDFIVKMTGMDAGIKSGAATLLGLRSAAGLAVGAGHLGGKAAAIGGKAADHAGGAVAGAVGGAIAGAAGGASAGFEGHDSITGQAVGATVGLHTGAAAGAARGGAEGARRGFMGLIRGNKNSNNSNPQPSESGTTTSASDSSTQAASSDTGASAAPPPPTATGSSPQAASADAGGETADTGTAAAPTPSNSDADGVAAADTPSVESGGSMDSASAPEVDSGSAADSGEREREGTIFTRAYSAGKTVGGVTGHPKNTADKVAWKAGSTKAKYDIAKAQGFKEEKATAKNTVSERLNNFVKGKYKDNNGNGGKK